MRSSSTRIFLESIYLMKQSENACSLWRTRFISFFSIANTVVGVIAAAVPMQIFCPARHPSPKKSPGSQHGNDGFLANLVDDREFHAAFLDIHYVRGEIALGEDRFFSSILYDLSRYAS